MLKDGNAGKLGFKGGIHTIFIIIEKTYIF